MERNQTGKVDQTTSGKKQSSLENKNLGKEVITVF